MPTGTYYFVIVGHHDNPLFEMQLAPTVKEPQEEGEEVEEPPEMKSYFNQFIAHSALDLVDATMWKTNNMYLKVVDRFNEWLISAFVTASRMRFLIVHDVKNEDGIKHFFQEMYEIYIKYSMNPFYTMNTKIISTAFDEKAHLYGRKYLVP